MPGLASVKAGAQIEAAVVRQLLEVVPVYPHHDALVWLGGRCDHGLVQLVWLDHKQVARKQRIASVFYLVIDLAVNKEIYFIKIMVVQVDIIQVAVAVMEDLKIAAAHSLPCVKGADVLFHNPIPHFPLSDVPIVPKIAVFCNAGSSASHGKIDVVSPMRQEYL